MAPGYSRAPEPAQRFTTWRSVAGTVHAVGIGQRQTICGWDVATNWTRTTSRARVSCHRCTRELVSLGAIPATSKPNKPTMVTTQPSPDRQPIGVEDLDHDHDPNRATDLTRPGGGGLGGQANEI